MFGRQAVRGHVLRPPRPTRWAVLYVLLYLGLPVVLVLALLDLALWWLFAALLGRCYGIICWLG